MSPLPSPDRAIAAGVASAMLLLAACSTPRTDAASGAPSTEGAEQPTSTLVAESTTTTQAEAPEGTRYADPVFTQVESTQGIVFAEVEGPDGPVPLSLDVYEPAGDDAADRALIVLFFGGGFVGGARDDLGMQALASLLTRHGYVVATPDYRTLGRAPTDGAELQAAAERAVADAASAVAWFDSAETAERFGIDPARTLVGGVSAGGVIAATLATTDDPAAPEVAAALVISGAVTDLETVDADDAPLFVVHEEFDPVVPCGVAAEGSSNTGLVVAGGCSLLDRAAAVGLAADGWIVESQTTHVGFSPEQFERLLDEATDFLALHVTP